MRTQRVLVMEDNTSHARLLDRLLEALGYQTIIAGNGREGVDTFLRHAFDIVVTDIEMPQMNGYEATRRIRSTACGRDVPIVALTGLCDQYSIARCYEAGMNAHLAKPEGTERLGDVLAVLLRASGIAPAVPVLTG